MPTRSQYIEQIRRLIYNGPPADDATITVNLVNQVLNQAIGVAAKKNYTDNIQLDGIGYVNGSFYSKFSGLSISQDSDFTWKVTIPEVPTAIGRNEGISTLELVDSDGRVTRPFIPISENQKTYYKSLPPIPNKVLYYYEGSYLYALSTLILSQYTANITMVSGGLSTDLDSTLNVPPDYLPVITDYLRQYFLSERSQLKDVTNDGEDFIRTT